MAWSAVGGDEVWELRAPWYIVGLAVVAPVAWVELTAVVAPECPIPDVFGNEGEQVGGVRPRELNVCASMLDGRRDVRPSLLLRLALALGTVPVRLVHGRRRHS